MEDMNEASSYWYQRYQLQVAMVRSLETQIKALTDQADYWFNLYTEEAELHTATLEHLEDTMWAWDNLMQQVEDLEMWGDEV